MNWACQYHYQKQVEFLALLEQVPSFGPQVDEALKEYANSLGNFVRANYCWSFEGKRYGEVGQEDRVPPLPKVVGNVAAVAWIDNGD